MKKYLLIMVLLCCIPGFSFGVLDMSSEYDISFSEIQPYNEHRKYIEVTIIKADKSGYNGPVKVELTGYGEFGQKIFSKYFYAVEGRARIDLQPRIEHRFVKIHLDLRVEDEMFSKEYELTAPLESSVSAVRIADRAGEYVPVREIHNRYAYYGFGMNTYGDTVVYSMAEWDSTDREYILKRGELKVEDGQVSFTEDNLCTYSPSDFYLLGNILIDGNGSIYNYISVASYSYKYTEENSDWQTYMRKWERSGYTTEIRMNTNPYIQRENGANVTINRLDKEPGCKKGVHRWSLNYDWFHYQGCEEYDPPVISNLTLRDYIGDSGWFGSEYIFHDNLSMSDDVDVFYYATYSHGGSGDFSKWYGSKFAGHFKESLERDQLEDEIPYWYGALCEWDIDDYGNAYFPVIHFQRKQKATRYCSYDDWSDDPEVSEVYMSAVKKIGYELEYSHGEVWGIDFPRGIMGNMFYFAYDRYSGNNRIVGVLSNGTELIIPNDVFPVWYYDIVLKSNGNIVLYGTNWGDLLYLAEISPTGAYSINTIGLGSRGYIVTGVMDRSDIFHMFLGSYDGSIIEHSIDLNSYTLNKTQTISTGFNYLMGFSSSVSASGDIYLGYLDNYSDIYIYRIPAAEEKELIGKLEFYTLDDILVDPTEYLPQKGDTFKVKYILEYDDGSGFTGYNENKTVKFSLRGTKEGDAPFEFIWSDDTTEEKSVILEAGENSVDCSVNLKSTSYFGVVGVTAGIYDGQDDIESDYEAENEMPEDTDNDLMADRWERDSLEYYSYMTINEFQPNDDLEKEVAINQIGDGITTSNEYKGFVYKEAESGRIHTRLNPRKKDVLIDINNLDEPWLEYLINEVKVNMIKAPGKNFKMIGDKEEDRIVIDTSFGHCPLIWSDIGDRNLDNGDLFDNIELSANGKYYIAYDNGIFGRVLNKYIGKGQGEFNVFLSTINNIFEKNKLEDLLYKGVDGEYENLYSKDIYIYYYTHDTIKKNRVTTDYERFIIKDACELFDAGYSLDTNVLTLGDSDQSDNLIWGLNENDLINQVKLHETGHIFGLEDQNPAESTSLVMGQGLSENLKLKFNTNDIYKIDVIK